MFSQVINHLSDLKYADNNLSLLPDVKYDRKGPFCMT